MARILILEPSVRHRSTTSLTVRRKTPTETTDNCHSARKDGNLFDDEDVLVKVDFDACQVVTFIDGMVGKLGSLAVSAQSLIGSPSFSGIDFESVLTNGIDDFFPDVSQYITGALNGEEEIMHILCLMICLSCT